MKPIIAEEIVKMISKFNQNKSAGHDGIGNFIVKNIAHIVLRPLADIFNLSLSTAVCQNSLKLLRLFRSIRKKMLKFSQTIALDLYYLVFRRY